MAHAVSTLSATAVLASIFVLGTSPAHAAVGTAVPVAPTTGTTEPVAAGARASSDDVLDVEGYPADASGEAFLPTPQALVATAVAPAMPPQRYNGEVRAAVGSWGGYRNGEIPVDVMCTPSWGSRTHKFRCDALAGLTAMNVEYRRRFGTDLSLTSTYRTYAQQVTLKQQKPTLAATPGTSNHGWGLAVDLGGGVSTWGSPQHNWLRENANRFGWYHPRWAQFDGSLPEPWHWEYAGAVASGEPAHARALAMELTRTEPWDGAGERHCLDALWQRASGWRYTAVGTGDLRGLAQASMRQIFGSSWASSSAAAAFLDNPQVQIERGLDDITLRYGTACRASAGKLLVRFADARISASSVAQGQPVTVSAGTSGATRWTLEVTDVRTRVQVHRSSGSVGGATAALTATWGGDNLAGQAVGTGPYRLRLTGVDEASGVVVEPYEATVQVTGSQRPPTVSPVPLVGDLRFVPVTPARVLDTRQAAQSIGPDSRVDVVVAGTAGVPADAKAVTLNVTAVGSSGSSHIRVWPAGQPRPDSSVVNIDETRSASASGVSIGVGGQGKVSLYNAAGSTHLVVDVTGYYTTRAGSTYQPLPVAHRALDTRTAGGPRTGTPATTIRVAGVAGVPADARAVVVNVTSVLAAGDGYVAVVPHRSTPTTSTVNHLPGRNVANRSTIAVQDGSIDVHVAGGRADVVVDVVGWYGPGGTSVFTPVQPVRALDTRTAGRPVAERRSLLVPVRGPARLPANAVAAAVTLTATGQTGDTTHLTVWGAGARKPPTSDLNTGAGRDQANMAIVPLGAGGAVEVENDHGSTHLVVDVTGYFGAAAR